MVSLMMGVAVGCQSRGPADGRALTSPPTPQASSPRGWRCPPGGSTCLDRADLAADFQAAADRFVQPHPVMPDEGEWTCGETAGVTLCTGGEVAAGVKPAGIGPGWICGTRRGPTGDGVDRACVDAAPDFPDGKATGWRCFYDSPALPNRICVRDSGNHVVGDACDPRHPCVDGALCRDGLCALPRRIPTCWTDADCGGRPCRFGNCPGDVVLPEPAPPTPPAAPRARAPVPASLDFGPPHPQVGFDAEFAIAVQVGRGPRPARITWRQVDGPPLPELRVTEDGFRVAGRTISWRTALGTSEAPWGVLPISPRTRGEAVLEASWNEPDGSTAHARVVVAAAALASGLTTIPVGGRLYLGGEGWHLRGPLDSRARMESSDGLTGFLPDVAGVWRLRDGRGRNLDLIAGRYEDVPLDCSRAPCHAEMLAGSLTSPMTTVLARLLDRFPEQGPNVTRAAEYPGCALACHTTGQPDISDGGFHDLARALKRSGGERTPWSELPRVLRRLGGAGCISCHGPGAVPDPSASWTTLRSDVCAVCHDAPPVYRHTVAWRSSANSRADRDPDAARKPECVRCHTTWGFLLAHKPRPDPAAASKNHLTFMASLRPPEQAGPIGIACAACHDSHPTIDATGKTPHALLRKVAHPTLLPALPLASARSQICLPCHTPSPTSLGAPFASTAAIWLGRGGVEPATGAPLDGPAPLGALDGGCLHCHTGDADKGSGGNHTFAAKQERCADCPQLDLGRADGVQQRARQLYLDGGLYRILGDVRPLHASKARIRRDTPAGRALWNLLLLLEDKAAEAHNPPYARALLESAEAVLGSPSARRLAGGRR